MAAIGVSTPMAVPQWFHCGTVAGMGTRTRDIHWRLDPAVVRRLEEIAFSQGVSVSSLANTILDKALNTPAASDEREARTCVH